MPMSSSHAGQIRWLAVALVVLLAAGGSAGYVYYRSTQRHTPPLGHLASNEPIEIQVHHFCGGCHTYPPAETFPKRHWKEEVERGYQFFQRGGINLRAPPIDDVVKYYVDRAPEDLPAIEATPATHPPPVRFEPIAIPGPALPKPHAISHISLVHLFGNKRPDILACDMRNGVVMALQPYAEKPLWKILGEVPNPAHAEVIDLDGDGILDILVADLGNFTPTDRRCGSVVWLRGRRDGGFTPITLLADVGRVADVQAADFRGVGKLDLIVASFGWNDIGEVIYLENQTSDWSKPVFKPRELDRRHGAIHVPVVDLNGDGRPDFVTVLAQEHETIVAFINDGEGGFRKETIWRGPHPAYGSSGIQLVDMNGDGRLDVLYTNGDTLDAPYLLKPYHSVQWLENPGDGKFPWKHHPIAPFYGAHRAIAADLCGAGKMDVAVVSFLPVEAFPQRQKLNLDALLLLERTGSVDFARHTLAAGACDAVCCAVGDVYGSGRNDIVTGLFSSTKSAHNATIWKNLGKK
jgi:hypothetical protein